MNTDGQGEASWSATLLTTNVVFLDRHVVAMANGFEGSSESSDCAPINRDFSSDLVLGATFTDPPGTSLSNRLFQSVVLNLGPDPASNVVWRAEVSGVEPIIGDVILGVESSVGALR